MRKMEYLISIYKNYGRFHLYIYSNSSDNIRFSMHLCLLLFPMTLIVCHFKLPCEVSECMLSRYLC